MISQGAQIRTRSMIAVLAVGLLVGVGLGALWSPRSGDSAEIVTAGAVVEPSNRLATGPTGTAPVDGMYLIGVDLIPGRYVAHGSGSVCFYSVTSDLSGDYHSIVTSHFGDAHGRRVELRDGRYFETDGCGSWQLEAE